MTKRDLILTNLKSKLTPLIDLNEIVGLGDWKSDNLNLDELPFVNFKDKTAEIEHENDLTNIVKLKMEVEIFAETTEVARNLAQKVFSAMLVKNAQEPYFDLELRATELIVEANALFILTINIYYIVNKNEI